MGEGLGPTGVLFMERGHVAEGHRMPETGIRAMPLKGQDPGHHKSWEEVRKDLTRDLRGHLGSNLLTFRIVTD